MKARDDIDVLTSSALSTARSCLRRYDFAYRRGIRPLETAGALRFGTATHAALEGRWRELGGELPFTPALPEDAFEAAKLRALMAGYDARWADDAELYEVIAIEVSFNAGLFTPQGHASTRWGLAGKLDGVIRERRTGRLLLLEHKTTSEDIRPGSDYWTRLRMDAQVSIYYDGAAALGHEVDGCLYDVIAKPKLEPLRATPVEKRKWTQGKRCKACKGQPAQCMACFDVEPPRLYADVREFDETPEEYEARCMEAIAAEPDRYFARAEVVRLESEILAARRDVWETSRLISSGHYPRNVDACMKWGRPCPYLPVCSGGATLEDDTRYRKLTTLHPELAGEIE